MFRYLVKCCFKNWWHQQLNPAGTLHGGKKYLSHPPIWNLQDAVRSLHFCSCSSFMTGSVNFTHGCLLGKYFPDLHVYSIDMWSWRAFLPHYGTSTHRLHTKLYKIWKWIIYNFQTNQSALWSWLQVSLRAINKNNFLVGFFL